MSMTNALIEIMQVVVKALTIFVIVIIIISYVLVLKKAQKRKEENISKIQDTTFDMPEETNPITEGERKTLTGMAILIKVFLVIITIIVLILPIIILWSALNG